MVVSEIDVIHLCEVSTIELIALQFQFGEVDEAALESVYPSCNGYKSAPEQVHHLTRYC